MTTSRSPASSARADSPRQRRPSNEQRSVLEPLHQGGRGKLCRHDAEQEHTGHESRNASFHDLGSNGPDFAYQRPKIMENAWCLAPDIRMKAT